MNPTKPFRAAAFFAVLLILGCGEQPRPQAAAPDIAAAPPAGATVHRFSQADWQEPYCAESMDWAWDVPSDAWIAWPVGWVATDEATARANWEHMSYRIWVDDRPLEIPDGVQLQVDSVRFECPDRVTEGVGVSPVVYLPPVDAERRYRIQYVFDDAVNDGWSTYEPGSDFAMTVTLRPSGG